MVKDHSDTCTKQNVKQNVKADGRKANSTRVPTIAATVGYLVSHLCLLLTSLCRVTDMHG